MSDEHVLTPEETEQFEAASGLVVAAATALSNGHDLQAHALLMEAKIKHPIETIDYLFGAFLGLMSTLADAADVDFEALLSLYALRNYEEAAGLPLTEELPGG